jgi:pimeloyl-ACP methyl ester carboxylesterase
MNSVLWFLIVFAAVGIGVWLASFVVEAIRPKPKAPAKLRWAPDIPIDTIEVGGHKLRYIKVGKGPALVLLHTLRTQLDLFEKVIPELSKHFTVYALDYPGHGYSDIPTARYDAAFFTEAVEGFLAKLDLRDVTLAGVSIGGSIVLIIAARRNSRVARVIAINPYDYAKGRGMARSSPFGWVVTYASLIPFIGETVMRLRNFLIMRAVLRGGVAEAKSIPPALLKEMYLVGNRPGHYRAFLSLLRNSASWEAATKDYGRIDIPVLLLWGDRDWARPSEREHDCKLIPGAQMTTIKGGGHFLALDKPQDLSEQIIRFVACAHPKGTAGRVSA